MTKSELKKLSKKEREKYQKVGPNNYILKSRKFQSSVGDFVFEPSKPNKEK